MTNEQRSATEALRAVAQGYRVIADAEGWPTIPGRLGRIEYHDGDRLAVYTDRRLIRSRILSLPLITRHQTGDTELRALFPAPAFRDVAKVIRARRKRALSPASLEALARARAASQFRHPAHARSHD